MKRKPITGRISGVALVTVVMITTVLTGCGGGGGGNNNGGGGGGTGGGTTEPPAAVTNLTLSGYIKALTLQWTPGTGATEFHVLFDADGTGQFQQVGSSVPSSSQHATLTVAVHEMDWAKAQFAVDACNSAGCTRSAFVPAMPAMLASIGYFKASNTGSGGQYFGYSVALSGDGNTMAVGAPLESSNAMGINGGFTGTISQSGAVYVFANNGGTWSQQAYVKASNPEVNDEFGLSVALSANGNTLAVGAIGKNSAEGVTYIFTRSGNDWNQKTTVMALVPGAADEFGDSVSLSEDGNTLVVGAPFEDNYSTGVNNPITGTATNSGAVYIFTNSGGAWSQQAYVKASNTDAGAMTLRRYSERYAISGQIAFEAFWRVDGQLAAPANSPAPVAYLKMHA
ncbi:MAG TPA: FG-GAP repeat protein [Candidatus Solibacter sp.]|nr:FG-GAP repeat protein [Candidatus Solibacter sp.]